MKKKTELPESIRKQKNRMYRSSDQYKQQVEKYKERKMQKRQEEGRLQPLITRQIETVKVREDVELYETSGEWVECNPNEYVSNGIVYKKTWVEKDKEVVNYFNPATDCYLQSSEHLAEAIKDEKVLWIANMVTYYRHTLKSYNNTWSKGSYGTRFLCEEVYQEEKRKVNERQKRKIIKNHTDILRQHGITVAHFEQLAERDEKTLALARKLL